MARRVVEDGLTLTEADRLRFNRWVARQVHACGMAVALKNDGGRVCQLVGNLDFAIVEHCFQYKECGAYRAFTQRGKAVFEAEYQLDPSRYCTTAQILDFCAIRKSYPLIARPWLPCPG